MRVLLGVSGGIAAYKAAEVARLLQKAGVEVEVAMTAAAERFVAPLTFAALTGRAVSTSLWQPAGTEAPGSFAIAHTEVARAIDLLAVVPATADVLARMAHGLADDFLTTTYLATAAPVLAAPAMNAGMWHHPATRANLAVLQARGVHIVPPEPGELACGVTGDGRLAEPARVVAAILALLQPCTDFAGETVLVTAGGTREPIDAVRSIANRSSGRMGLALAAAAQARGARVVLITASALAPPPSCETIHVQTAAEMHAAVLAALPRTTVVIKAAAVGDFRVEAAATGKLRRDGPRILTLVPTEDIAAAAVAQRRTGTLVIAFAAETEDLEANARAKLARKGVDAIVANDVSVESTGFDAEENAGLWITHERTETLPRESKARMAGRILDGILALRGQQPFSER